MVIKATTLLSSSFVLAGAWSDASLAPRANNGAAVTPPMGWNSYNHYACVPNETIVMSNAQAMVDLGLKDAGYHYVTTDCGWTLPDRTANGSLTWNATLFPSGFPVLGQQIHKLGLQFGVYSDAGINMCMNGLPKQIGSLGYEYRDAETFASWGADLLKYDNCYSDEQQGYPNVAYSPSSPIAPRFEVMASAIKSTKRPMLFAICDWGVDFPSAWAPRVGNTWRITNDIIPEWKTIARITNQAVPQTDFAGPGRWLDLDMMEVGNNIFTEAEEQTHMSLWSIIKSPLIIGAALKDKFVQINKSSLAIYKNRDVISSNQDSLGVAASFKRRWTEDEYEVWSGPLSGDRMVAALVNWANKTRTLTLDLPVVGLQRAKKVKSVWTNTTLTNVLTSFKQPVQPHGTMLLEIVPGSVVGTYDAAYFASTNGTHSVFKDVYGVTTSSAYAMVVEFGGKRTSSGESNELTVSTSAQSQRTYKYNDVFKPIKVPISLQAGNNNTITLSHSSDLGVESITVEPPKGTYYPSTSFSLFGSATRDACTAQLCRPVGSKIGKIGPSSGAELSIASNSSASAPGKKYVEVDFTNNDIALATAWNNGTNTRNLTIAVNGLLTRIEVPLSGRSSEAFSPRKGWEDTGTFGVLVDGFGAGKKNADDIVVSNAGGSTGVQPYGADFVGLRVFW